MFYWLGISDFLIDNLIENIFLRYLINRFDKLLYKLIIIIFVEIGFFLDELCLNYFVIILICIKNWKLINEINICNIFWKGELIFYIC